MRGTKATKGTNGRYQFGKYERPQWRTLGIMRPAIVRLAAVSKRIEQGDFVTQGELAEELGVKRMTLIRDLRTLRAMGHQVEYDVHRKGWFYRERPVGDDLVVPGKEAALRRRQSADRVADLVAAAEKALENPRFYFEWEGPQRDPVGALKWEQLSAECGMRSAECGMWEEGHERLPDLRAVLMYETAIAVSSPASWISGAATLVSSFSASTSISSQKPDSSASSSTVPNLDTKSAEDFARHAAR